MSIGGSQSGTAKVEHYVGGDISKETNWWGAFVIGLAGTILITGVTGPALSLMGSAGLPNFFFITSLGWLLCLFLAEMAAMLPERTGGAPAYAYFAFKDRFPRLYPHINGITFWMYWIGWWPVLAVNNLLIGSYLLALFHLPTGPLITVFPHTPVSLFTLILGTVFAIGLYVPAYLGIRFGTVFATILGLLSMIPMTILALLPFFHPSSITV